MATLPMISPDLRYSLAIAWLDRAKLLRGQLDVSSTPPLTHDPLDPEVMLRRMPAGQSLEDSKQERALVQERDKEFSRIGECVVRADTETVRWFLAGPQGPRSADRVAPLLMKCVPANFQLRLRPAELTGLLALSYARLALAAQPQTERTKARQDQQAEAGE